MKIHTWKRGRRSFSPSAGEEKKKKEKSATRRVHPLENKRIKKKNATRRIHIQGPGGAARGGPALMIVVKDGVRKRRVKVNRNDSYQEVEVQFVSEKMILWKRSRSAVSRRSGQTSEGWHAGRRRSHL